MSFTHISTVSANNATTASIDFNNIPQIYSDLYVVFSLRAATDTALVGRLYLNGLSTGFFSRGLDGTGSGTYSFSESNLGYIVSSPGHTANTFGSGSLLISNYRLATTKSISHESVSETNASASYTRLGATTWSNNAAITSLSLAVPSGYWSQYSTASLYGINRIPTASLGATPTVDYLVVAGGGTGGGYVGGGGGAGGLLTGSAFSVASGSAITVTVGAGGAGGSNSFSNGSNSTFSSITATGGGHGGQGGGGGLGPATSGGSGGGGGSSTASPSTLAGAAGTSGQGNAGGNSGGMSGSYPSGGGGGAGAVGVTPGSANTGGGNGGAGLSSTLTGLTTYYAGGGGGANSNAAGYQPGVGGIGGGGNGGLHNNSTGATITAGTTGVPGTGGGGGGGGDTSASGGSGVVIIRYPDTYSAPTAVTGNPAVKYVNGYRVYIWTASGSITF